MPWDCTVLRWDPQRTAAASKSGWHRDRLCSQICLWGPRPCRSLHTCARLSFTVECASGRKTQTLSWIPGSSRALKKHRTIFNCHQPLMHRIVGIRRSYILRAKTLQLQDRSPCPTFYGALTLRTVSSIAASGQSLTASTQPPKPLLLSLERSIGPRAGSDQKLWETGPFSAEVYPDLPIAASWGELCAKLLSRLAISQDSAPPLDKCRTQSGFPHCAVKAARRRQMQLRGGKIHRNYVSQLLAARYRYCLGGYD